MKQIVFVLILLMGQLSITLGQERTITGTVTDASDGSTLPGVSILVQGTTAGTVTDINGRYEIRASDQDVLVFSFIGMVNQEIPVGGRSVIDVAMESELVGLEEVLVIAYGTVRRESFTGVADVVTSERIERRPVADVSRALEGTAPGIQVTSGGGQPGEGVQVRLRGFGSISASNAPLYVVDGMAYDGNLSDINPQDIESITVLRDASAAALYGARAANGVIMITTKRGSERMSIMNFRSSVGFVNRTIPEYPTVNEREFMLLNWEALRNSLVFRGTNPLPVEEANQVATQQVIGFLGNYNPFNMSGPQLFQVDPQNPWLGSINPDAQLLYSDNWEDEIFRTAMRHEHQFSISGGGANSDYFMSLSYLDEQGMAITSGFDRLSTRVNVNARPRDWFEGGVNVNASLANSDFLLAEGTAITNPFYFTRGIGPIYPVYLRDTDGSYILDEAGNRIFDYGIGQGPQSPRPVMGNANLAGTLILDDRSHVREVLGGRTFMDFNILENLSFRVNLSGDYYSQYITTFQNPQFGDAAGIGGRGSRDFIRSLSITFNQLLNYSTNFGLHNLDFLAGHESYQRQINVLEATRTGFPIPGITEIGIATNMEGSNSYRDQYRLEGYFTRLSYDFDNRYYASASFRRDGSSRFHPDSRWGNFFSLGVSWRLTQEAFMQDIPWLNNLRFKASYGEQGNDALATYYAWQRFYNLGMDNFNLPGALYSRHETPDLVWETSANTNVGFDFRIFDLITGEIDYFHRESSNLLFSVPLPLSTGVPNIDMNIGTMVNSGLEFRMVVDLIRRRDLRWSLDANITHLRNEITRMPPQLEGMIQGTKRLETGRSLFDYYLREVSHIDPQTGQTHYFFDITDEQGNVTRGTTTNHLEADRYYVGSAIPDFFGGFTNALNFRNFDLSFLFTYSVGGLMYDNIWGSLIDGRFWAGDWGSNIHSDRLNRWRQPGDETGQPRIEQGNAALYAGLSDQRLHDMSYLALKNVTLGFVVPANLTQRAGITNLRIFASGDNLFILNEIQGMDPQHSFAGTTDFTYVPVRTITFGVNLQF